jgi:hypothetical protein
LEQGINEEVNRPDHLPVNVFTFDLKRFVAQFLSAFTYTTQEADMCFSELGLETVDHLHQGMLIKF